MTLRRVNTVRDSSSKSASMARLGRCAAALLFAGFAGSCTTSEILRVEDPDVARPEAITGPEGLPSLLAGAIGNFGVTYDGGNDFNQVTLSGQLSDEFINTETFPTRIEVDQRRQQVTNGSLSGVYYALQQARTAADVAAEGYAKYSATAVGFAEALNLSALTHIILAENYCGSVPLSKQTSPGVFEFGPALTTRELLDRAIQKADSALAIMGASGANATNARVARIVKARALVDLNDPVAAATAINGTAGVPTTFQYNYIHTEVTTRQNNGTWNLIQNSGRFGVADVEGLNGLPFRSEGDTATPAAARDPRVANVRRPTNSGRGFDGATNMWWQLKYPVRSAPITIADGVEARLIEAEAALRTGNYATATTGTLAILNALRADAAVAALRGYTRAMPALVAAATQVDQENQLFKERAYWLFLTSHRLGDLRRLSRPANAAPPAIAGYGRGIETVYPTGNYHKGGTYGIDVNSPVPQAEENNPNFVRNSCNVAAP
ncbi:MAG TPA: hypothetical protein VFT29_12230 [Gemmatimonadaceae bacterium]|nr:hypothetical protein [Gemmatimonadaceae bacterium]